MRNLKDRSAFERMTWAICTKTEIVLLFVVVSGDKPSKTQLWWGDLVLPMFGPKKQHELSEAWEDVKGRHHLLEKLSRYQETTVRMALTYEARTWYQYIIYHQGKPTDHIRK